MGSSISRATGTTSPSLTANAVAVMLGRITYLASRVALPPLILRYLSLEEYGVWTVAFVLISYLGMGTFGIANVYVRFSAIANAQGRIDQIQRLLATGMALAAAIGLVLFALVAATLPHLLSWLAVAPALRDQAGIVLLAACGSFVGEMVLGAFGHVLIGLGRSGAQTAVWVSGSVVEAILIVVLLALGAGAYGLAAAFAVRTVGTGLAQALLCFRVLPGLELRRRDFDRETAKLFWTYGGWVQCAGLLGIVLYSIEKVIAGMTLGASAVALFDVGEKFAVMLSGIPASLNAILLPAVAHRQVMSRHDDGAALYLQSSRYISALGGLLMAPLALFASPLMTAWIGSSASVGFASQILATFAFAYHMHVVTGPASAHYRGVGAPARELLYPLGQLGLIILTISLGFHEFGPSILVIAVCVSASMVASAALYEAVTNSRFGISQVRYFATVWGPGLLPYAIATAIAAASHQFVTPSGGRLVALATFAIATGTTWLVTLPTAFTLFSDAGERALACAAGARLYRRVRPLYLRTASGVL